jgi:hypothetical protein
VSFKNYELAIPILGLYAQEMKLVSQRVTWTYIFIETPFTIAKKLKQLNVHSVNKG